MDLVLKKEPVLNNHPSEYPFSNGRFWHRMLRAASNHGRVLLAATTAAFLVGEAQASSATASVGRKVTLSSSAQGTAPFTYQWYKNDVAISGATAASHVLNSVTASDAASYTVVVRNSAGSARSDVASLTVSANSSAPTITSQPSNANVQVGQSASFSVTASSSSGLGYQWKKNGSPIAYANAARYTIASAKASDAGSYSVTVSNSSGSTTSNGATLTVGGVLTAPFVTSHPVAVSAAIGTQANFSVGVSGTAPFTYQWRKNGSNISGANSANYSIPAVRSADAGTFSVAISNSAGSIVSNGGVLTVVGEPSGTSNNTGAALSLWSNTTVPTLVDGGADRPVELGSKIRSDVAGTITAIRFYKSSGNTGTHVGSIWSSNGSRLASITFTSETSSGWQQANLQTPLQIAANTVYVVSYHASNGHYSADLNYFSGKGRDNGSLHALASGVAGLNGVYAYGSAGTFPSQSYNNTNYWVDVVFRAQTATAAPANVWSSSTVPSRVDGGADSPVELGMKFRSDVSGRVTAIRFYKAAANTGTHVGSIWSASGTRLASVTFANESASGWQTATLSTPLRINANTVYVVSYHAANGHYSADLDYFAGKGVDAGVLHALPNGMVGGNGLYRYGPSGSFPNQTFRAANYWVDFTFQAD